MVSNATTVANKSIEMESYVESRIARSGARPLSATITNGVETSYRIIYQNQQKRAGEGRKYYHPEHPTAGVVYRDVTITIKLPPKARYVSGG